MTFREKLEKEHPDKYIPNRVSSAGCPSDYEYETPRSFGNHCKMMSCRACWDREIPEEKEENKMIYAHIGPAVAEVEELTATDEGVTAKARILDSGNRRQFESGAVRDIQEGKGRCDLLPLDVVADIYTKFFPAEPELCRVPASINMFKETGDVTYLYHALDSFIEKPFGAWSYMFLEVAVHFEEGAKKYGENNWQKGIPVHCYIDSAVRHYLKFLRGDKDEPHDRAFCWNIMCAIWTCKHKPELNEYAVKEEK